MTQLRFEPFEPLLEFIRRVEAEIGQTVEALEIKKAEERDSEVEVIETEVLAKEVRGLFD